MASNWPTTRSAALKILGNKAKFPEPKNMAGLLANLEKSFQAFDKSRDAIEDRVTELQNAGACFAQAMKQFAAIVDKADFGLDRKNKDDAKKIEAAQAVLTDYVDGVADMSAHNDKALTELDKHLMLMSKYKQSA